jgi:hypothetical protein
MLKWLKFQRRQNFKKWSMTSKRFQINR